MPLNRRSALPLVLAIAAACADLNLAPNTVRPDLELALTDVGTANVAFQPAFLAVFMSGVVDTPVPSVSGPALACPLDAQTPFFACATITLPVSFGYATVIQRSYQLLDAAGTPLLAFDKGKVNAIRVIHDRDKVGGFTNGYTNSFTTYMDTTHNDFTMSGLLGASRVLNGSGTTRAVYTDTGVSRLVVATYTTVNLAMPQKTPGMGFYNFPESGVATYGVVVSGPGIATDTVTVQVTFTGSNTASYTRTKGGVTKNGTCYQIVGGTYSGEGGCSLPVP